MTETVSSPGAASSPIRSSNDGKLVTLKDAATYITELPRKESAPAEWQTAIEALMVCSRGGDPRKALISILRAMHRGVVREFNPTATTRLLSRPESWRPGPLIWSDHAERQAAIR